MTVTSASLREDFPEFSNTAMYPDTMVDFWLGIASAFLNADRWSDNFDYGVELFTAHNMVLEARAQQQASAGGLPGTSFGLLSSKSVGPLAMSYDTQAGILKDGDPGDYNLTIYGIRFYRLLRMFGAGGVQVI